MSKKVRSQELQLALEKLTDKQRRFVEEYSLDWCASKAILRAGYNTKNPDQVSYEVLGKTLVKKAVNIIKAENSARNADLRQRLIRELAKQAFSDIGEYVDWNSDDVSVKPKDTLKPGATRLVKKVKFTPSEFGTTVDFELVDKMKSQEMLAKHLGIIGKVDDEGEEDESDTKGTGEGKDSNDPLDDAILKAVERVKARGAEE